MHIGLTLPSRSRSRKVRRLVESIRRQLSRHQVTLCLGLDEDEPERPSYDALRRDYENDSFRFHVTTLGRWAGIGAAFNAICADLPPDVETISMLGDDMIFVSAADAIFDVVEEQLALWSPDKLGCVIFHDKSWNFLRPRSETDGPPIAVNGFVHRNWLTALGEFLPVAARGDFADNYLTSVCLGVDRYRVVSNLMIAHLHQTFYRPEADETGARKIAWEQQIGYGNGHAAWKTEIEPLVPAAIEKLQSFIELHRRRTA